MTPPLRYARAMTQQGWGSLSLEVVRALSRDAQVPPLDVRVVHEVQGKAKSLEGPTCACGAKKALETWVRDLASRGFCPVEDFAWRGGPL